MLAASGPSTQRSRDALEILCQTYWFPVYSYLRRRGYNTDEAQDLTQSFFARLLEKDTLRHADSERGRFRSFLLASLMNFAANERQRAHTARRGGTSAHVPLDALIETAERRYAIELRDDLTPEELYHRHWVSALLVRVLHRVREEFVKAGKGELFESLKTYLTRHKGESGYSEVAARLDMSEGALKVAVHRLRRRYRDVLHEEIAHTVASADEADQEIRDLLGAVRVRPRGVLGVRKAGVQITHPR